MQCGCRAARERDARRRGDARLRALARDQGLWCLQLRPETGGAGLDNRVLALVSAAGRAEVVAVVGLGRPTVPAQVDGRDGPNAIALNTSGPVKFVKITQTAGPANLAIGALRLFEAPAAR